MQPDRQPDCVSAGLNDFVLQLKLAQQSLLDMSRRLDEYQAQSKSSFASLKRGISKQVDRVPASKSSTTTAPAPSVGFTQSSASIAMVESATSVLSNTGAAKISTAPAYVAPQVLEEMPTPRSDYENYSSGNPNPIQISVHGESTNFSEQNLDGRPQSYGFHNLNRQSVFLADGTECSYFTLPADYPLERAVPELLFDVDDDGSDGGSNESVHVFSTTPEQQSYEEERQGNEQLLKCVDKAPETEQTIDCLSYISDVFDYAFEQQQQDGETSVKEHQHLRAPQLNVLVVQEKRKKWDPGALIHFTSSKTQHPDQALQLETRGIMLACSSACSECKCWIQNNIYVCQISENGMAAYTPWDPGILNVKDMMLDKYTVNQQVQFGQRTTDLLFLCLTGCIQCIAINDISVLHDTSFILQRAAHFSQSFKCSSAFGLAWTKVNASVQFVPVVPCFKSTSAAKRSLLLSSGGNNRPSQSIFNLFLQSLCATTAVHVTDCMRYIASNGINPVLRASVLVMQRDARLSQGNCLCSLYFNSGLKTEYCQEFSMNLATRLQWDPGVRVSLGWLYMLAVWSETDKSLYCTHIPDLASWPNQPVSSAVCIWDPGIGISSPLNHWWLSLTAATEKPLSSLQTPEPATWLSLENNASYAWDPGTILIQNKSVLLLLFTEEKEMVNLIIDNWKFHSQQSVKTNNTAKNLLSLQNYL